MPGGIDTSKRKPRRLRGTPALRYINISSICILAGCSLLGALLTQAPGFKRLYTLDDEFRAKEARELRERQMVFRDSLIAHRSAEDIQKVKDHKAKYDFET